MDSKCTNCPKVNNITSFLKIISYYGKKCSILKIRIHGFRYTHCSLLFESGFTIQEVQDRLGHSDLKTTMSIYAHVTEKQRDNMADKFAKFMAL